MILLNKNAIFSKQGEVEKSIQDHRTDKMTPRSAGDRQIDLNRRTGFTRPETTLIQPVTMGLMVLSHASCFYLSIHKYIVSLHFIHVLMVDSPSQMG